MRLTGLPADVLLQVLRWCDVKTILCMQRTCRQIHSLSLSRSLWMSKASGASPETSPSIPSHSKPSALSDSELRAAIVSPTRSFTRLQRGETYYSRRSAIDFPPLYTDTPFSASVFCAENIQVTAGGRYIVVNSVDTLHVIDTAAKTSGDCIWSRSSASIAASDIHGRSAEIRSFATEMLDDRTFNILILSRLRSRRVEFLAEVYHIFPEIRDDTRVQTPIFVQEYSSLRDDSPCLKGDYIILPGEDSLTVTDWRKQRTVEIAIPDSYSMTEPLKLEVYGDHVFFVMRTFHAIQRRRYEYEIHAVRLSSLFDDHLDDGRAYVAQGSASPEVRRGLGEIAHASIILPHTDEHTLVSTSRLTISSPLKADDVCLRDSEGKEADTFRITLGGKFWLSNSDTVNNFFSLYVISFRPSSPLPSLPPSANPACVPSTAQFILEHFPEPQRHPFEKPDQQYLIAYASACPSFTIQNRGLLMHTIARSHTQMSFFLSMIGLNEKAELTFGEVVPRVRDVSNDENDNGKPPIVYKLRAPVDQYDGSIVLMSADSRSCEIWHPI